jgi:hypothetical protein
MLVYIYPNNSELAFAKRIFNAHAGETESFVSYASDGQAAAAFFWKKGGGVFTEHQIKEGKDIFSISLGYIAYENSESLNVKQNLSDIIYLDRDSNGKSLITLLSRGGSHASVIYDGLTDRVLVCTDAFNTRQLYFRTINKPNRPKPLTAIALNINHLFVENDDDSIIDFEKGLPLYIAFGTCFADTTPYKPISRIPAGTIIEVNRHGDFSSLRYYDLESKVNIMADRLSGLRMSKMIDELETQLYRCIELIPKSNPLYLFLSGGSDSRLIAEFLSSFPGVSTTALGMRHRVEPFDLSISKRIAIELGLEHQIVTYQEPHSTVDTLRSHLFRHGGMISPGYYSELLSKPVGYAKNSVLINGNNGNQIFGDYLTRFIRYLSQMFNSTSPPEFSQYGTKAVEAKITHAIHGNSALQFNGIIDDALVSSFSRKFMETIVNGMSTQNQLGQNYLIYLLQNIAPNSLVYNQELDRDYLQCNPFYSNPTLVEFSVAAPMLSGYSRLLTLEVLRKRRPNLLGIPRISGYPSVIHYDFNPSPESKIDNYYDSSLTLDEPTRDFIDHTFRESSFLNGLIKSDRSTLLGNWQRHIRGEIDATNLIHRALALNEALSRREFIGRV